VLAASWLIFFLVFSSLTVARNRVWMDNITLFEDTKLKSPDSLLVHWTLFREYRKIGDEEKARAEYREMKRINKKAALGYLSIARKYKRQGRIEDAKRMAQKALWTKSDIEEAKEFLRELGETPGDVKGGREENDESGLKIHGER
jgi:tetratricopeptide (TPR) repeat protein